MLDSMVYDKIVSDAALHQKLKDLVVKTKIQLLTTHVQQDEHELLKAKDRDKYNKIQEVLVKKNPTVGFILGVSRLGEAILDDSDKIEKIQISNPKHAEDALIATTAESCADCFVTEEIRLIRRVRRNLKVQVWNFQQFREYVDLLT